MTDDQAWEREEDVRLWQEYRDLAMRRYEALIGPVMTPMEVANVICSGLLFAGFVVYSVIVVPNI